MRYIASLISGVGIFMMGSGLSWYHGIMGLMHPQPIESFLWVSACLSFFYTRTTISVLAKVFLFLLFQAYCILAGSLVSEGGRQSFVFDS